ncbi:hypothetical protein O4H49_04330 [Kiloniella laminariae]|uniref:Uncharacterized protein n=1 Tax=Kiloniella laminariae TaxID=454162 RepID=A0ABT4LFX1_9PROT|nr:hypothetical protein [Kiloniella laminariae]MCZ4279992.1 hypothetical protein [Kiloniella laminariae]
MTTPIEQLSSSGSVSPTPASHSGISFALKPADNYTDTTGVNTKAVKVEPEEKTTRKITSNSFMSKFLGGIAGTVIGASLALVFSWLTIEFIGGSYGLSTIILVLVSAAVGYALGQMFD